MLIGLDGSPLANLKTGVGHYTFELARALATVAPADDFQLISPLPFGQSFGAGGNQTFPKNLRAVTEEVHGFRKHWWTFGLSSYIRRNPLALFHGTNYDIPLRSPCPTVLTIHDLSSYLHPETHTRRSTRRARYRLPIMARRATMIITPSAAVKNEVCELLRVEPRKVAAIPHAARPYFRSMPLAEALKITKRIKVDDCFLLFVGTIEPRKNLITLIRAFEEVLKTTSLRPQLVIAGMEGWLTDDLFTYVEGRDLGDRIIWTGYVSDEDLCALYSACRLFLYPSIYEGFGLPLLEAMACGAPVISSRIPAIVETVGNAACLIRPTDVSVWSRTIIELLQESSQRNELSKAGQQRAAEFSWEHTARLTRDVYSAAVESWESRKS